MNNIYKMTNFYENTFVRNSIMNTSDNNIVIYADNLSYILDNIRPKIYKNNKRLRMKLIISYMNYFNNDNNSIIEIIHKLSNQKSNNIIIITENKSKYEFAILEYTNVQILNQNEYYNLFNNKMKNYYVLNTQYNTDITSNNSDNMCNNILIKTI